MTRVPLAICLALAWFFVVNALASGAVLLACRRERPARADGRFALVLRLLPAVSATLFAGLVFGPGFLLYEPARGPEPVGWSIRLAAAGAVVLCALALARTGARWWSVRALVRGWEASAAPVELAGLSGTPVAAFAVDDSFPVMALVGIRRPRLFIARQVLAALGPGELRAAVAHELAHARAGDNIKRLMVSCCPDLLGCVEVGRRLERRWAAWAERAADRCAAASTRALGVDLAGALVKVSRLASTPAAGLPLFSALHERGDVADRVARLVAAPTPPQRPPAVPAALAVALGAAACLCLPGAWAAAHSATEACLRLLP